DRRARIVVAVVKRERLAGLLLDERDRARLDDIAIPVRLHVHLDRGEIALWLDRRQRRWRWRWRRRRAPRFGRVDLRDRAPRLRGALSRRAGGFWLWAARLRGRPGPGSPFRAPPRPGLRGPPPRPRSPPHSPPRFPLSDPPSRRFRLSHPRPPSRYRLSRRC